MIPTAQQQTWRPNALDARMGLCVVICCLTSCILTAFDLRFPVGEMRLDVIQKVTACISCLLCCQDGLEASRKAGLTRVLVTAVGGLVGVLVVALDLLLGSNMWLLVPLLGVGLVATLCLCRLAGAPAFNARIGGITFLLVACTLSGTARIWYAVFRLVSTVFGAVVVSVVTQLLTRPAEDR
ncbi:MAG: FUSC family protein [Atopobiaceae bacterium]|nr:FUSC family protein [Atopobiaceae bacterium]MBR3316181.1 FUSC family protein [Atopobiaceae bacterium]